MQRIITKREPKTTKGYITNGGMTAFLDSLSARHLLCCRSYLVLSLFYYDIDGNKLRNEAWGLNEKVVKQYCLSHKLKLPDAQIAATAILYNVELFTLNRKDFAYIPNLKLYEPEENTCI